MGPAPRTRRRICRKREAPASGHFAASSSSLTPAGRPATRRWSLPSTRGPRGEAGGPRPSAARTATQACWRPGPRRRPQERAGHRPPATTSSAHRSVPAAPGHRPGQDRDDLDDRAELGALCGPPAIEPPRFPHLVDRGLDHLRWDPIDVRRGVRDLPVDQLFRRQSSDLASHDRGHARRPQESQLGGQPGVARPARDVRYGRVQHDQTLDRPRTPQAMEQGQDAPHGVPDHDTRLAGLLLEKAGDHRQLRLDGASVGRRRERLAMTEQVRDEDPVLVREQGPRRAKLSADPPRPCRQRMVRGFAGSPYSVSRTGPPSWTVRDRLPRRELTHAASPAGGRAGAGAGRKGGFRRWRYQRPRTVLVGTSR